MGFINDLPVRLKALAAFAALLICLCGLGSGAMLTLDQSTEGLRSLSGITLPKQNVVDELTIALTDVHVGMFRFVALAGNRASERLLEPAEQQLILKLEELGAALASFVERPGLDVQERATAQRLVAGYDDYSRSVRETVEIGRKNPAIATMLLSGTDGEYERVSSELQRIAALVVSGTVSVSRELVAQAERNKLLLTIAGALGVLASLAVAVLVTRSIIDPIRSITKAMKAVSAGATDLVLRSDGRADEIGEMLGAITACQEKIAADNRLLNERKQELRIQYDRLDAALSNMSQGLALFDRAGKLIVCNSRFHSVNGLSPDVVKPGVSLRRILEHRVELGMATSEGAAEFLREHRPHIAARQPFSYNAELADGRALAMTHQPVADGGWVVTAEDITERRRAEGRIAHMARHDALTDLANRALLREKLERALGRVKRGERLAVLCLDLDRFKSVNDTLGHPAGDAVLKEVAERLRRCVRDTDTVARLGGDEFAILQTGVETAQTVLPLARRIIEALSEPYTIEGHEIVIGTSVGIALAPGDGSTPDALLKSADLALYRAKSEGRGTFRYFEPEMDAHMQVRRTLEIDLRRALANGEFELYYQPLVNLESDRVIGCEALLRWHHPERGMIAPLEFIPLAEEVGLIIPLGDWVLRQACAEAATWPNGMKVAVNLSPVQFRDRKLVQTVVGALASSGLPGSRLELEITETVLLQDSANTLTILHQLKSLGVCISMDDFGTGYSSLQYLRSFPFDKIKIDRSFVQELESREDCVAIVRAVASLGTSLGMVTTAEGVENVAQLEQLRAQGCTEVQGYLFSPPRPASELLALLRGAKAAA
jgi:diguanylate cyclase (GGDEF)-like protein